MTAEDREQQDMLEEMDKLENKRTVGKRIGVGKGKK